MTLDPADLDPDDILSKDPKEGVLEYKEAYLKLAEKDLERGEHERAELIEKRVQLVEEGSL